MTVDQMFASFQSEEFGNSTKNLGTAELPKDCFKLELYIKSCMQHSFTADVILLQAHYFQISTL